MTAIPLMGDLKNLLISFYLQIKHCLPDKCFDESAIFLIALQ